MRIYIYIYVAIYVLYIYSYNISQSRRIVIPPARARRAPAHSVGNPLATCWQLVAMAFSHVGSGRLHELPRPLQSAVCLHCGTQFTDWPAAGCLGNQVLAGWVTSGWWTLIAMLPGGFSWWRRTWERVCPACGRAHPLEHRVFETGLWVWMPAPFGRQYAHTASQWSTGRA